MKMWIANAIAHGVMAGRNFEAARQLPEAAGGLRKVAARHLQLAVTLALEDGEEHHAMATAFLAEGVAQPDEGEYPAGPGERRGRGAVARKAERE